MTGFDVDAMLERFHQRAEAAKRRALPPIAGEERQLFLRQQEADYTDYSIIGAASWQTENGFLVLRIDMRPPES